MSTIALPSWVKAQSLTPPTIMRSTLASTGRYSGHTDISDFMSGDVWSMSLGLVPMSRDDSPRLEALVNRLVGGLNLLSCHHLGSPLPRGTLRGSPTLSAAASIGASSLTITGATAGVNMLTNSSFEGSLSGWVNASGSQVATVELGSHHGTDSMMLVKSGSDTASYMTQTVPCLPSTTYTLSGWIFVASITAAAFGNRSLMLSDSVAVSAPDESLVVGHPIGWSRKTVTMTTSVGATELTVYLYAPQGTVFWDEVQLEIGASATQFAGLPEARAGDMLGVGSAIFQVAEDTVFGGAPEVVPTANKVRSTLASSSPVIWNRPTALWRLIGTPQMLIVPGYANGVQMDLMEKAFA